LVVALFSSIGLAQVDKEFSKTVPFNGGESLTVKTYKGSIHVSSWDRAEVEVLARISPPDGEDPEYAASVVEATEIEVLRKDNRLMVRTNSDRVPSKSRWLGNSKNLAYVHYEIRTPREVDLKIDDYKSDIEVYELSGDFDLKSYKGRFKGTDLQGRLVLETYKGTVDLAAVSGTVDLETYKGEITVQMLEIDGPSKLNTYKGDIELRMSLSQGLTIQADPGRKGTITGNLVSVVEKEGDHESSKFIRQVNDGGPTVKVSTYKGTIRLNELN
jgi:hypothetical protein